MQDQLFVGRPRLRAPQAVFLYILLYRQDETKSIYQRGSGKTRSQKKQRNVLDSVYGNEELTLAGQL